MATRPEHDPKNQTPKARLKRVWNKSGLQDIPGYVPAVFSLNSRFREYPEHMTYLFGAACTVVGVVGNAMVLSGIDEHSYTNQVVRPDLEESVTLSQNMMGDTGSHYIAVSSDDGRSGYALFNHEGDYRLYQLNSDDHSYRSFYNLHGLIDDADDAWRISLELRDVFTQLSDAVEQGELPSIESWQVVELPNLTVYEETDTGAVARYSDGVRAFQDNGWSVAEQYADLEDIFDAAATHFVNEDATIPADEFAERAGELTFTTTEHDNPAYAENKLIGHVVSALGAVVFTLSAIPPIVRRRKYLKNTPR